MNRGELAEFLRSRRSRLTPAEVALPAGARRRTPGLRRGEVAQLAGMSTDYYKRLEQARGPHPSRQVLAALARALRLNEDERDHLYRLAGEPPPAEPAIREVSPGLLRLLDELHETPALVVSEAGDMLAWNPMHAALMGDPSRFAPDERNVFWLYFTVPEVRERFPEADRAVLAVGHVANLRAMVARWPDDPRLAELVDRLCARSHEFAGLWAEHGIVDVRRFSATKRVQHPLIGVLELDCDVLTSAGDGNRLVIHTAPPGSEAHQKLQMLGVAGLRGIAMDDQSAAQPREHAVRAGFAKGPARGSLGANGRRKRWATQSERLERT